MDLFGCFLLSTFMPSYWDIFNLYDTGWVIYGSYLHFQNALKGFYIHLYYIWSLDTGGSSPDPRPNN